jgi:hypothetical protein
VIISGVDIPDKPLKTYGLGPKLRISEEYEYIPGYDAR